MEFDAPLPAISLAVVGVDFDNADGSNRRFGIALCRPGDGIELRLEPNNPADKNAVAVWSSNNMQLGYITAERAPRIGAILREGREVQVVFQREAPFGAWVRAAFDGETPDITKHMMLAEEKTGHRPPVEPEFYPDEIWPDD